MQKQLKDKIIKSCIVAFFITLIIVLVYFLFLKPLVFDNFSNMSGYGLNNKFGKINTLIPLNNISKSTDFKLFSLMTQIKFSFLKPPSNYEITGTKKGIVYKTGKNMNNIILFSGQSDFILKQNNIEVWPENFKNINNNKSVVVYNNNNGHFNTITTLFENLNYKYNDKINTILYDFRNINFDNVYDKFIEHLKDNTVIIAYDFGAVIANICINTIPNTEEGKQLKNKISKLLLICPTIGGIPMTLRDYFSGNGLIQTNIIERYHSILLSMPNEKLYDKPVAILNNLSYKSSNINILMNYENKPTQLFTELRTKYQNLSMNNPNVNTIIIANDQVSTPVCYNFRNNLKQAPERYNSINNNQFPVTDIQNNGTFEGLQATGDGVVPISVIHKLKNMWGNNCKIELVKNKDHFTILKSYELELIIIEKM